MRRWTVCLVMLAVAIQGIDSRATEPPYTFTINGVPFAPRVVSLHGDPKHPAPGDLIALGTLLLTLGPERDCQFVIAFEDNDWLNVSKVFLRLADGRQRVVGVRVLVDSMDREGPIINPLPTLSTEEVQGLWGIYLDAWSDEIAQKVCHIDPTRACITVAKNALIQQKGKNTFPPLPKEIQYLNTEGLYDNLENGEVLRQWTQLRFLHIEGDSNKPFDAQWLDKNRAICRLDLNRCFIEHPETLSQLDRLECLDLSDISNLATVAFAKNLPRLRSLNLSDTAVWDLSPLARHKGITKLDVSRTKVSNLSLLKSSSLVELNVSHTMVRGALAIKAKHLETLDISETMVRDLSPLWKLERLTTITATNSTVETLPSRPMPAMRRLTAYSTPLSQDAIDAFAKLNPKCDVLRRWTDELRLATSGAMRLRIRTQGPGRSYYCYYELAPLLNPGKTLFEITDPARIRDFVRLIEIDEKKSNNGCWDGCCLEHGPTFEFYRENKLCAVIGWTDIGICSSCNWPMLNARLTPQSLERATKWLADQGYDDLHRRAKQRLAKEESEAKQRAAIARCYPEQVRRFFDPPSAENEDDVDDQVDDDTSEGAKPSLTPSEQIAKAVGDPVKLAVITCRAMGAIDGGFSWKDDAPKLVVAASGKMDGNDLLKALGTIPGDKQAELGAARLYFGDWKYRDKIPEPQARDWMLRLAAALLNHGDSRDILRFLDNGYAKDRELAQLIRRVARGELGRAGVLERDEAGLRASAYLMLADSGASDIKPEVERLLAETKRKPDVAALEIALVLLGDAKHLKPEHFGAGSVNADAALRAIENFNGREGLDVLVEAGLSAPDEAVRQRALLLLQDITDEKWYDAMKDQDLSKSVTEAKKWWREHGAEFVARCRSEQ